MALAVRGDSSTEPPSPSASWSGMPVLVTMMPSMAPVGMVSNSTARPPPPAAVPPGLVLSSTTPP